MQRLTKKDGRTVTTMADIAQRAGVALSTVSYALSGKRPVSAEVRQRIQAVMDEMNYRPHALARALASKRTRTIALLFPSLTSSLAKPQLEFVAAVAELATARHYATLLWTSPSEDDVILDYINQGMIDGLILMEIKLQDRRVDLLREMQFPFSMIGRCEDNTGLNFVDFDFYAAAYEGVRYLASLGHRSFIFLNESNALLNLHYGPAMRMEAGFQQAIQDFDIRGTILPCEPNAEASFTLVSNALDQQADVTAIISCNPWTFGGITRAITDRGLSIPHDIAHLAIIATHTAEMMSPALTAMDIPVAAMGMQGASMLIQSLEEPDAPPQQIILPPQLTVRQTTGPMRAR